MPKICYMPSNEICVLFFPLFVPRRPEAHALERELSSVHDVCALLFEFDHNDIPVT